MTKNNLKIVKTDDKKQKELKEKTKSLEAAIDKTPTGSDNLFEMADAINELESGDKEPLEKNNSNLE